MGYSEPKITQKISAICNHCGEVYFANETNGLTQRQLNMIECLYCGKKNAIKYKVK